MAEKTLNDLFYDTLKDIYYAERQVLKALPKMARRRLARAGHDHYHVRHQVTGAAIPRDIAYFAMQVEFVANTLLTIVPIPEDFRKDHYWPRLP